MFAYIDLCITDGGRPEPKPAPFFTRYRPKGKEPESGQTKVIGGMVGWHGIDSAAVYEASHRCLHFRIMTGAQPPKNGLQHLCRQTIGDGKSEQAQHDKWEGLIPVFKEDIKEHENIQRYPGIRITQQRHDPVQ